MQIKIKDDNINIYHYLDLLGFSGGASGFAYRIRGRSDRIIVFEQGRIMEDGKHKELINKGGLYKALWDAQIGGFLPEDKKNPSSV